VLVDGKPVPGALFDFALYFFHNARELLKRGSGPYFYLPKMQSHLEARLWNAVFLDAQALLGIPRGTIKVRFSYGTCTFHVNRRWQLVHQDPCLAAVAVQASDFIKFTPIPASA